MLFLKIYLFHIICYWSMCIYYDDMRKNYMELKESIKGSIINQIFVTYPFIYLYFKDYPLEYNNLELSILFLPFLLISADFYFYIIHRFCHEYLWFIHRYHHRGKNFAVKSLDAHVLEHLFCNLGSIICGVQLLKHYFIFNVYILYLWTIMITINTCLTHSEIYDKKGEHLVHHKYLNYNYGVGFYLMDRIVGTYKEV